MTRQAHGASLRISDPLTWDDLRIAAGRRPKLSKGATREMGNENPGDPQPVPRVVHSPLGHIPMMAGGPR